MSKILMVDDDAVNLVLTGMALLERANFDLQFRQDGADALALLAKERFDLVVTDYIMPSMNGVAMIRHLRSGEFEGTSLAINRLVPVIINCGLDPTDDRISGLTDLHPLFIRCCGTDWDKLIDDMRRFVVLDARGNDFDPREVFDKVQTLS